jgi:hypothetical protein
MLERIKASPTAIEVARLVAEPESRKALVAAVAAGRVLLIDGDRVVTS